MARHHHRWTAVAVFIGVAGGICAGAASFAAAQEPAAKSDSVLGVSLGRLASGDAKLVDLAYPLNDKSPFWPGDNYQPFQLRTIATLEQNGVLSKTFAMPEHFGTHLDAPCHFEKGQPSVEAIRSEDLFAPGVLIDITMQAETDADYRLLSEIAAKHGLVNRLGRAEHDPTDKGHRQLDESLAVVQAKWEDLKKKGRSLFSSSPSSES